MGEEQSQGPGPEQQLPPQEQEQPVEQSQQDGENTGAAEATEPNTVDQNDDPDTRWDHDKSETMAAVLKEDGTFDNLVEKRENAKQFFSSQEYIDSATRKERMGLEHWQKQAESHNGLEDEAIISSNLEKAQEAYDARTDEVYKAGQEGIEASKVNKVVDEVLSPYQELYDTNPAVFAEMPTAEFMVVAKELAEISRKIEASERDAKIIKGYNDTLKDAIEGERLVKWELIADLSAIIEDCLGIYTPHMDDPAYAQVHKKFNVENAGSFDKTPRQVMEGYMRVAAEYTAQFEAKKQADEQRKKEFLDKYKPEASDQDQN